MTAFIDEHRDVYGVEPICKVLPIAPSTYYTQAARRVDPELRPNRAWRDDALCQEIRRVWDENKQVYGVRKVWKQLRREGYGTARCTVERLMRRLGLRGVIRGRTVKTTVSDKATPCPLDRSTGSSARLGRTRCGSATSPMSRPGRALSTWRS